MPEKPSIQISPAKEDDADIILDILLKCTDWLNQQGKTHWKDIHTLEAIIKDIKQASVFIASRSSGEVLGTVTLDTQVPWYYGPEYSSAWSFASKGLFLRKLAVSPSCHGEGIGGQLVSFAAEYANGEGFDFLRLDINTVVSELLPYYEGLDFSVCGRFNDHILMEKPVSANGAN